MAAQFVVLASNDTACRNVACSQLKSGGLCVFNHHELFIFALLSAVSSKTKNNPHPPKKKKTAQPFKNFCFRFCASTTTKIRIGSLGHSRVIFVAKPSTL